MTRHDILDNIDNPRQLESLYRDDKAAFKTAFTLAYPELTENKLASYWYERLHYETAEISWGNSRELIFVIIASLIAAIIAKLPLLFNIDEEFFYQRNAGFIIFPIMTVYFVYKKGLSAKKSVIASTVFLIALLFINLFPQNTESNTLLLSCIHLPIILWAVLGIAYTGENIHDHQKRLNFLRFNGDLVILTTLILITGGILTAITIGLFSVIGFNIEDLYIEYVAICGLAAAPIVASYIIQTNPRLISRVSPLIAKIFSPLVLITLVIFLVSIIYSDKDPYNDRDFLMMFNFLLIGVMAIILFAVAGTPETHENRTGSFILFALSIVTIVVNGIALSAILFRISEWGMTPNRLAVLGGNVLMLLNLLLVAYRLFKNVRYKADISEVGNAISVFLPVYILWASLVTFIFPLLFQFK